MAKRLVSSSRSPIRDASSSPLRVLRDCELLRASRAGDTREVVRLVLQGRNRGDFGGLVDCRDEMGRTALMEATAHNHSTTALVLLKLGARADLRDKKRKSPLALAIAQHDQTLTVALMGAILGQPGGSTTQRLHVTGLSTQEIRQLFGVLESLDAARIGRAISLIFLVDPQSALLTIVRVLGATVEAARMWKVTRPEHASGLFEFAGRLELAIAALLENAAMLVRPLDAPRNRATPLRQLVACVLDDDSSALKLAVRFECKLLLSQPTVQGYLDDKWAGNLAHHMLEAQRSPPPSSSIGSRLSRLSMRAMERKSTRESFRRNELRLRRNAHSDVIAAMVSRLRRTGGSSGRGTAEESRRRSASGEKLTLKRGSVVEHEKHGRGVVAEFMHDGRVRVEFDDGQMHRYHPDKWSQKLTLLSYEDGSAASDEREKELLTLGDVLVATPRFLLQAPLWLPLTLFPPLRARLRRWGGRAWLLEAPCVKFAASFTGDVLFFVSMTLLAEFFTQRRHYPIGWLIPDAALARFARPAHALWAGGIVANELGQLLASKESVAMGIRRALSEAAYHARAGSLGAAASALRLLPSLAVRLFAVSDFIELSDVLGPIFVLVALVLNEFTTVDELDYGATASTVFLAAALLLLGWRLLRLQLMLAAMGPLVLMVNQMIGDVGKWLLIELTLLLGFASSLYTLGGSPHLSATGVFPDACELTKLGDYHTSSRAGALSTWFRTLEMLVEAALMGDPQLECVRRYAAYPASMLALMIVFQITSTLLMVNMLIAMMAKTFDRVYEAQAYNFAYLRARVIFTWVDRSPAPPPINLLVLPGRLISAMRGSAAQSQGAPRAAATAVGAHDGEPADDTLARFCAENGRSASYALLKDFRDEQHAKELAGLISDFVAGSTQADEVEVTRQTLLRKMAAVGEAIASSEQRVHGWAAKVAPAPICQMYGARPPFVRGVLPVRSEAWPARKARLCALGSQCVCGAGRRVSR